jgi:hypothetical protein
MGVLLGVATMIVRLAKSGAAQEAGAVAAAQ